MSKTKIVRRTRLQVLKLWVRALRSEKYRQGKSQLRTPNGSFCCLGVLCDLAAQDGGPQWQRDHYGDWVYAGEGAYPPVPMGEYVLSRKDQQNLTILNDTRGWSFSSIADYIEENYIKPGAKN